MASILTLHGLCFRPGREGPLHLLDSMRGDLVLPDVLQVFEGSKVTAWWGHFPEPDSNPPRWGLGSCYWSVVGKCPVGHHKHPETLWGVWGKGVFRVSSTEVFEAGPDTLPLKPLEGHLCRVIIVPELSLKDGVPDLSQMDLAVETLTEVNNLMTRKA